MGELLVVNSKVHIIGIPPIPTSIILFPNPSPTTPDRSCERSQRRHIIMISPLSLTHSLFRFTPPPLALSASMVAFILATFLNAGAFLNKSGNAINRTPLPRK